MTVCFAVLFIVCSLLNVAASNQYPICLPSQPSQTITTDKSVLDVAYDPHGDKLYVAYWDEDVVDVFNRDGSKNGSIDTEFNTWGSLSSVTIDAGVLYASLQNRIYVRAVSLCTKEASTVLGPLNGFGNGNIIAKGGHIYIVNYVADAVVLYESSQESKRFTTDGLRYPQDAAFDHRGNLHVVGTYNGLVYVFDPCGSVSSTYGKDILKEPNGIFIDDQGNRFIADRKANSVFVFNKRGDNIRTIHLPELALNEFHQQSQDLKLVLAPECDMWVTSSANKKILIYRGGQEPNQCRI